MATATLVAGERAVQRKLSSAAVTDILWTAARPGDGLEHIHAVAIPGRVDLTLFHRAENLVDAIGAAGGICLRALNSSPTLAEWHLTAERH